MAKFWIFDETNRLVLISNYDSPDSILNQIRFAPNSKTYILTHGIFDTYEFGSKLFNFSTVFPVMTNFNHLHIDWLDIFKNQIYTKSTNSRQKPNFIIVDWHSQSYNIYYNKVSANIKLVSAQLTYFIRRLNSRHNNPLNLNNVHMIGNDFGAQVVGQSGVDLKQRVRFLTALDPNDECVPSLPFFESDLGHKLFINRKLSQYSAKQVTGIHTSSNLGTIKKVGQVDIFVNGGSSQPGCLPQVTGFTSVYQGE